MKCEQRANRRQKIVTILFRDTLKLSVRSSQRDTGFEPAGDAAIAAALSAVGIHLKRNPDRGLSIEQFGVEVSPQDSDDDIFFTVERDALPDNARVAREPTGPDRVAQDNDVSTIGTILLFPKCAAVENRSVEEPEKVRAHANRRELLGIGTVRQIHELTPMRRNALKNVRLLMPDEEVLRRAGGVHPAREGQHELYKAVSLRNVQRLED